MNWQRHAIGVIGLVSLVMGSAMYFLRPDVAEQFVGVMVRVGLLLCVIWLAMPQLEPIKSKIPLYLTLIILLLLIVAAARPRIFPVISGIIAVSVAVNFVLKWVNVLNAVQGRPPISGSKKKQSNRPAKSPPKSKNDSE